MVLFALASIFSFWTWRAARTSAAEAMVTVAHSGVFSSSDVGRARGRVLANSWTTSWSRSPQSVYLLWNYCNKVPCDRCGLLESRHPRSNAEYQRCIYIGILTRVTSRQRRRRGRSSNNVNAEHFHIYQIVTLSKVKFCNNHKYFAILSVIAHFVLKETSHIFILICNNYS